MGLQGHDSGVLQGQLFLINMVKLVFKAALILNETDGRIKFCRALLHQLRVLLPELENPLIASAGTAVYHVEAFVLFLSVHHDESKGRLFFPAVLHGKVVLDFRVEGRVGQLSPLVLLIFLLHGLVIADPSRIGNGPIQPLLTDPAAGCHLLHQPLQLLVILLTQHIIAHHRHHKKDGNQPAEKSQTYNHQFQRMFPFHFLILPRKR